MASRTYTAGLPQGRGFVFHRQHFLDGTDTPSRYLERCIKLIRKHDRKLNAFVAMDLDHARQEAERASKRYQAGQPRSILDGCPLGVKDIIHTARMATAMGSPLYKGWAAPADASCVAALREAGVVVVGKTHTTEFAAGESAPTTNPWKRSRSPGGSSSGSAAAVGAGMLPLALGTQTVGSILRPASYCGAVGYKPSLGALPMDGIHPLSRTLDHVGPIAASVEDAWGAALLMQRGFGPESARNPPRLQPVQARAPQRLMRIDHLVGVDEREPGVQDAFDAYVRTLQQKGVLVESLDPDCELARGISGANDICVDLLRYEMRHSLGLYLQQDPRALGPRIRDHLEQARHLDLGAYHARMSQRIRLREAVAAADADAFLLPAASGPAPKGLAFTGSRTMLAPWSAVGGPAWTLPLLQVNGLPMGVQLCGAPDRDSEIASMAHWMAQA